MGVFSVYTAGNLEQDVPDYRELNPSWHNPRPHNPANGKTYTGRASPVKNRDLDGRNSGF